MSARTETQASSEGLVTCGGEGNDDRLLIPLYVFLQFFSVSFSRRERKGKNIQAKEMATVQFYSADMLDRPPRLHRFVTKDPRKMQEVLGSMHQGTPNSLEEICLVDKNPTWNAKVGRVPG